MLMSPNPGQVHTAAALCEGVSQQQGPPPVPPDRPQHREDQTKHHRAQG